MLISLMTRLEDLFRWLLCFIEFKSKTYWIKDQATLQGERSGFWKRGHMGSNLSSANMLSS